MKSMFAAIGALALAATAVNASPAHQASERHAVAAAHEQVATSTDQRNSNFDPRDWSTNRGAGQTRSQDANNG